MSSDLYSIETGAGNLPRVVLKAPDGALAEVYLHGGTLTRWQTPDGVEQLYLSPASFFEADKPIRGGVPVCWPQFGARGPLPIMHGFARLYPWMFAGAAITDDDRLMARFVKFANDATHAVWDHDFSIKLDVTLGGNQLDLAMEVTNPASRPFEFSGALHTYFRVAEVAEAAVEGLQGAAYMILPKSEERIVQEEAQVRFAGLVNRVYPGAPATQTIVEPGRRVQVSRSGFPDTVVWNIGEQLNPTMPDLPPDGYRRYICIEAAIVEKSIRLTQGQTWRGTQVIRVLPA
jgi:glucose-6-phosphate 1-epimerase